MEHPYIFQILYRSFSAAFISFLLPEAHTLFWIYYLLFFGDKGV